MLSINNNMKLNLTRILFYQLHVDVVWWVVELMTGIGHSWVFILREREALSTLSLCDPISDNNRTRCLAPFVEFCVCGFVTRLSLLLIQISLSVNVNVNAAWDLTHGMKDIYANAIQEYVNLKKSRNFVGKSFWFKNNNMSLKNN